MTSSNEAEQHRRYSVHVAVQSDDFTFAAAETEPTDIQPKTRDRYDVKVRGVFGFGECDPREMEKLGRNWRWTGEGLEYEASSCAAGRGIERGVEDGHQMEDTHVLDGTERNHFRSLAATLNCMSLDRSDVQYAAKGGMHEDGESGHMEVGRD